MCKLNGLKHIPIVLVLSCFICITVSFISAAAVPIKPSTGSGNNTTIDTVLTKVEERFAGMTDLSGIVDLEQYTTDGTVVAAQTTVKALFPGLLRLEFVQPETFAGSIYVIDRDKDQVMQYSPITEQVLISKVDQVISERYVPTTVEQLFSLPSPDDYDLTIIKTEKNLVNVSARPKNNGDTASYRFWIDQNQWMVQRMQVFDGNTLLFTITLSKIVCNSNLNATVLRKMPAGAIPVYR